MLQPVTSALAAGLVVPLGALAGEPETGDPLPETPPELKLLKLMDPRFEPIVLVPERQLGPQVTVAAPPRESRTRIPGSSTPPRPPSSSSTGPSTSSA